MERDKKKENFYVFLDFDGVLNDFRTIPSIFKLGGFLVSSKDTNTFNKGSIDAVNYLLETLSTKYNTKLVLSTTWRRNPEKAKQVLYNNGLNYDGEIDCTPRYRGRKRAFEILKYLVDHEHNKINFVTIDDKKHINHFFKKSNCISTSLFNALDMSKVINYLDTFHKDTIEINPPKDLYGIEK